MESSGGRWKGGRMKSAIYEGTVQHRRFRPREHQLAYKVWYLLVDLDELDEMDREIGGFGNERRARVSFFARDHGPRDGSPLRPWIEAHLARAGVDIQGGPIRLLTLPRTHGYAFNPITTWFCHGPLGDLRALLYEVSNTFGEWHHYLVPVEPAEGMRPDGRQVVRVRFSKELFVSPFLDMAATYDIATRLPNDRASVAMTVSTSEGRMLTAAFDGTRSTLTTSSLKRTLRKYPLLTLKIIVGIHWEAIKLWRKGAPYRSRGEPPKAPVSIVTRHREGTVA